MSFRNYARLDLDSSSGHRLLAVIILFEKVDAPSDLWRHLETSFHENDPFLLNVRRILPLRHFQRPVYVNQILGQLLIVVETGLGRKLADGVCIWVVKSIAAGASCISVLTGGVLETAHPLLEVMVYSEQVVL
jgi:hypothetical protein